MLDLERDFALWAFSSLRLEWDAVGSGALSVEAVGWLTGGGVAEEQESRAFPSSLTRGVARANKGILYIGIL